MLRSLLVALKPAPVQASLVEWTLALADRRRLSIEACAAIDLGRLAPPESVPIGGSSFKADRDAFRVAQSREQAAAALLHLETAAKARSISCSAAVVDGETSGVLAQAAQRCDLLVCGHTDDGDASERVLLQNILKHTPRPAIVVPEVFPQGSTTLIAYDGSFQAARALASFAASGLEMDQNIQIVVIDDDPERARAHGEAAQEFLRRHELLGTFEILRPAGRPADQILSEAARVGAGLLVMGAFGKGAVHEFLLGSVTRQVLKQLSLPVFLDH